MQIWLLFSSSKSFFQCSIAENNDDLEYYLADKANLLDIIEFTPIYISASIQTPYNNTCV